MFEPSELPFEEPPLGVPPFEAVPPFDPANDGPADDEDGYDGGAGGDPVLVAAGWDALLEFEESLEAVRLEGLDADATLVEARCARTSERRGQARQLVVAAHWADLHAVLARPDVSGKGRERLVRLGGDGTPEVAEFAPVELGAVLGVSDSTVTGLVADALDLRHRLPVLWRLVQAGQVDVWLARKTAQETRTLTKAAAALVDAKVAGLAGTLTWRRLRPIVAAAVLAADPPQAQSDADRARSEVGVTLTPDLDHGYATMMIKAAAGDVKALAEALDLIARGLQILGDPDSLDQRRAKAAGWIANPKAAQALIDRAERVRKLRLDAAARTAGDEASAERTESTIGDPMFTDTTRPDETPPDDARPDPAQPDTTQPGPAGSGHAGSGPTESVPAGCVPVGRLDRKPLTFGTAVLYYHLTQQTLDSILAGDRFAGAGVVRLEDIGPVIADQVKQWLGHANVVLKPVVNLPGLQPVDHYETPPWMSEAIGLQRCADAFPYGTCTSRRQDNEHTIPYLKMDDGGPPGQTDPQKMSKMTRFHHRVKTFGGWTVRQVRPGAWLYRTPHGHHYLVDQHGTTALGKL